MYDFVGLDQEVICGGVGKQLCSTYILKVDPTKFAGQLNVSYER